MILTSAIGIVICFTILIISCIKKFSTILAAVFGAGLIGLFAGNGFIESIYGPYMKSVMGFLKGWMVILALGALLGAIYAASGGARCIGEVLVSKASDKLRLPVFVMFGGLISYSGMVGPIALFILLPLARVVFPKAGIPWYLFPGIAVFASCTFAMCLPGSLSVVNLIPAQMMGQPATAAPLEGTIASLFILLAGVVYLEWQKKKGAGTLDKENPEQYLGPLRESAKLADTDTPSFLVSIIPLAITLFLGNIVRLDITLCLGIGCIIAVIMFWKYIPDKVQVVSKGFNDGIMPCMMIAAIIGIGGVVTETPVFAIARDAILALPIDGLFKLAVSTSLIAGLCASASGGVQVTLSVLGDQFLAMGLAPDIIARVASVAGCSFDTMPWNGTVVLTLALSAVNIKKGYKHIFVLTCLLPIMASLIASAIYMSYH